MTRTNILRNVIAIAICLAATTFSAQAQLGGAIRNATNAARQAANRSAGQAATNATTETATQAAGTAGIETPASQSASGSSARPAAARAKQQPWTVDKDEKGTIQATFADGVLTFKGAGEMFDFQITMRDDERPWAAHAKEITSAVVEEGITYLGRFAYYGCENLTSVSLPASLTNIGSAAFYGCKSLTTITLPKNLYEFSTGTVPDGKGSTNMVGLFGQCTALKEINVADGNEKYKSVNGVL